MKVSIFQTPLPQDVYPIPREVHSLGNLAGLITRKAWSPLCFSGERRAANVQSSSFIAFDIDGGLTCREASNLMLDIGLAFILAPTKSHQKLKGDKPACDRFRLVVPTSEPILSYQDYKSTRKFWAKELNIPFDPASTDCFFYPSVSIEAVVGQGMGLPPFQAPIQNVVSIETARKDIGKGLLASETKAFLMGGAIAGSWNNRLFKAAKDAQEQEGYSLAWFEQEAEKITGYLDKNDARTIQSAYATKPKYPPRKVKY